MSEELFSREFFCALDALKRRRELPGRGKAEIFQVGRERRGFEHREYQPGDDPRSIDWRAYARTGRRWLRLREQERGGHLLLLLDRSASMTANGIARDFAQRRLALALGWLQTEAGGTVSAGALGTHSPGVMTRDGLRSWLTSLPPCQNAAGGWALPAAQRRIVLTDPWCVIPKSLPRATEIVCLLDVLEEHPPLGRLQLRAAESDEQLAVTMDARHWQRSWHQHLTHNAEKVKSLAGSWTELRGWDGGRSFFSKELRSCAVLHAAAEQGLV